MVKSIYDALLAVQKEITNPPNTATNPFFKSKYAPLPDILNQVRPLLAKHGLILIQNTGSTEEGVPFIQTKLCFSGASSGAINKIESDKLILNPDKKGVQGIGSAITYGRRYQLSALLGISSEDDNDGNGKEQTTTKPKQKTTPPRKPRTTAKKKPKSATPKHPEPEIQSTTSLEGIADPIPKDWKQLTKDSPALKKVCDIINKGGFDLDTNTVWVEAGSMHTNGQLTDKELDEIEVILGRKPA